MAREICRFPYKRRGSYRSTPLERRDIQVQTVYIYHTGRRVTNSRFQFLGTQGEYFSGSTEGSSAFFIMAGDEIRTRDPKPMSCRRRHFVKALVCWATGKNRLSKLRLNTSPSWCKPPSAYRAYCLFDTHHSRAAMVVDVKMSFCVFV